MSCGFLEEIWETEFSPDEEQPTYGDYLGAKRKCVTRYTSQRESPRGHTEPFEKREV